jgi:hypothetical protein
MILRGIDVAAPQLDVPGALGARAAELYPLTLTACLPQLDARSAYGGVAPADLIRSDADKGTITAALGVREDPEGLTIRTPVRIQQGEADTTVFKAFTDPLVADYRTRGVKVTYKTYKNVDHGGAVENARSAKDATSYIKSRLR